MPPLWSSKQEEAAHRSVTSRNQVDRSATKWCPAKTTSMLLRSSAHGVAKFTATKSWFKTPRHRRDEPSKTKDIQHQCLLGVQHRQHARAPMWVVTFCSRPDVGSRVNDALSVSQILAHNFENVMVTYASIFTGPQAQIPSSPYQQRLGLVRGKGRAWLEASTAPSHLLAVAPPQHTHLNHCANQGSSPSHLPTPKQTSSHPFSKHATFSIPYLTTSKVPRHTSSSWVLPHHTSFQPNVASLHKSPSALPPFC